MDNILVITQNLKLQSLAGIKNELVPGSVLIVSTQYVFENEREIINKALGAECKYLDFADLLNDEGRQKCDEDAYNPSLRSVTDYYNEIKKELIKSSLFCVSITDRAFVLENIIAHKKP